MFSNNLIKSKFSRKLDPSNRGTIPKSVLVEALSGFGDRMSPDRVIQVLDDGYMENFTHLNLDEFDYRYENFIFQNREASGKVPTISRGFSV